MTLTVLPSGQIYYPVEKSLRFNAAGSSRLSRTPAVAGNRQIWTWSGWVKRSSPGTYHTLFSTWQGTTTAAYSAIRFNVAGQIDIFDYTSTALVFIVSTTMVLRDFAAWYHIVVAMDTTQAVASDRLKIYVNGVQVTSFTTTTYPTLNYQTYTNNNKITHIGGSASLASGAASAAAEFFDGYIAEVNFVSGLARDASYFGEFSSKTGEWVPKKYTGIYGSTGFYLKFTDNSTLTTTTNVGLGRDYSGNGNYFTQAGMILSTCSVTDSPTLTNTSTSNYSTLNVLASNASLTIQDAALTATSASTNVGCKATIAVTSGKWYWEATLVTKNGANPLIGIYNNHVDWDYVYVGNNTGGWGYAGAGTKYNNSVATAYGAAILAGDIVGVALDLDNRTLTFYKNGVSQGVAFTSLPVGLYSPAVSVQNNTITFNFGQLPFAYTIPTGYKRLNSFNLPDPLITKPEKHMSITTYSGIGLAQTFVNDGNFQPGMIWAKSRSEASASTIVNDSIRGASKNVYTNLTNAEDSTAYITSLNSNGFSISGANGVGSFANTYVAWQWKTSLTNATNNAGSVTSTVRANPTAGFSVVQFTTTASGSITVGHGLNVTPTMIILKSTGTTSNWWVYHNYLGPTQYILLNSTAGPVTAAGAWNNTAPTSTVFTVGTSWNGLTNRIAYCFSEVEGYSKTGLYVGNGLANGTFVYTGFRPKFILFRQADATARNWLIYDVARNSYNVMFNAQRPNLATADTALDVFDFVSTGFKLRTTDVGVNAAGIAYIYIAFADSPFKYSNAR